ncbi:MAG: hypothetical protein U0174_22810 [Polyangiaceae bacterium]
MRRVFFSACTLAVSLALSTTAVAADPAETARCKTFSETRHKWAELYQKGWMKDACNPTPTTAYSCEFRGPALGLVQAIKSTSPDSQVAIQKFGSDSGNSKFMLKAVQGSIPAEWLDAAALFLQAQKQSPAMPNTLVSTTDWSLEGGANLYAADCSSYADLSLRHTPFHLAMIDVLGFSASSKHAPSLRTLLKRSASGELGNIKTYAHEQIARALFFMRQRDAAPEIASALNAYGGTTQEDHRVATSLAVLGAWKAKEAVSWCTAQITEYAPYNEKAAQCAMYLARVGDSSKAPYILANLDRMSNPGVRALGLMGYAPAKKRLLVLAEQGNVDAMVALLNLGDTSMVAKIGQARSNSGSALRFVKASQGKAALSALGVRRKSLDADSQGAGTNALTRAQLGDDASAREVARMLHEGDKDVRDALVRSMFFDLGNGDSYEGEPFYHPAFLPALEKALAVEGDNEQRMNLMFAILTQRALKK